MDHAHLENLIQAHNLFLESKHTLGERLDIRNAQIMDYKFRNYDFSATGLIESHFNKCVFEDVSLYDAYLSDSVFDNCIFINASLSCAHLYHTIFRNCVFIETSFIKGETMNTEISDSVFMGCDLKFLFFTGDIITRNKFIHPKNMGALDDKFLTEDGNVIYP